MSECGAFCIGVRRSLCRGPAVLGRGGLCIGPLRSLYRAPALSVSGPGALCVGARRSVSGPGALCVGPCVGPWRSVSGPGAVCVGLCRAPCQAPAAQRSPGTLCVGPGALFVRAPLSRFLCRDLCRAPALSLRSPCRAGERRAPARSICLRPVAPALSVSAPRSFCVCWVPPLSRCLCPAPGQSCLCQGPALGPWPRALCVGPRYVGPRHFLAVCVRVHPRHSASMRMPPIGPQDIGATHPDPSNRARALNSDLRPRPQLRSADPRATHPISRCHSASHIRSAGPRPPIRPAPFRVPCGRSACHLPAPAKTARAPSRPACHPSGPVSQQLRSVCHIRCVVCGPPAQIRVPPIQPGAFPFSRREPQTVNLTVWGTKKLKYHGRKDKKKDIKKYHAA